MFPRIISSFRTSLKQQHPRFFSSPTGKGTAFEKETIAALKNYAMITTRCGGAGDKGIDFRGTWYLTSDVRVAIVGQCKNYKAKLGPTYVRELIGVVAQETPGTLGILASPEGFTKAAFTQILGSQLPLLFVTVREGTCAEVNWNRALDRLLPGQLTARTVEPTALNGLPSRQILICLDDEMIHRPDSEK